MSAPPGRRAGPEVPNRPGRRRVRPTGRYLQAMTRSRRSVAALVVLLAVVTGACGGGSGTTDPSLLQTPFAMLDDGAPTRLTTYAGRPVLVNFFASWCAPCVAEMPDLEIVHQEYRDRVVFLGIDTQEKAEDGRRIVAKTGITYPVGLDPDGELFTTSGGLGMPTTVLIRADGSIADRHSGALTADKLRAMIDKAFF